MGNFLESPKREKDSHECELNGYQIGVSGMQGWRLEMEDAHLSKTMPDKPDHTFLAVFDG